MNRAPYFIWLALLLGILTGCASAPPPPNDQIRLIQSKRGAAIAISDKLLFDFGKATLRSEATSALDQIAALLKNKSSAKVLIEGHTDNRGSREANERISLQRANNVRQALIDRGVDAAQLGASGYGFEEPIESNETDTGRAKNRRVEVVFPNESLDDLKATVEKFKGLL